MTKNIEQQLIDNISQLLKRSIVADSALLEMRQHKAGNFSAIFPKGSVFNCSANTFQPYIAEVADDLMAWQKTLENELLVPIVKKIEQLYKVLTEFESHYEKNTPKNS
ncbi:MAG: hypothetical protein P8M49_12985 [Thalassotalea sp.]|nr:hypothetical protein [Thalassotalea sp.]MDG2394426.1 hypothetical protein [Thalassotalea sp.]